MSQSRLNFESFQIDEKIREVLGAVLKQSKFSRAYLAGHIQELSNQICTEEILHNWTGPSRSSYRIPACIVPAFCEVTGDLSLLDTILNPIDRRLVTEEDVYLAKVGQLYKRKFEIESEISKLEGRT